MFCFGWRFENVNFFVKSFPYLNCIWQVFMFFNYHFVYFSVCQCLYIGDNFMTKSRTLHHFMNCTLKHHLHALYTEKDHRLKGLKQGWFETFCTGLGQVWSTSWNEKPIDQVNVLRIIEINLNFTQKQLKANLLVLF